MILPIDFEVPPGFLRGEALRNWLRTDGAGIFSAFNTGAGALDFARELGVAIRTQDFYTIRNEVLSVIESSQSLSDYPTNQLVPLAWHVQDHGLELSSNFQYRVHMFGADREEGVLSSQWVTVASDRQLTIDQIKDVARSFLGEGGDSDRIFDPVFGEIESLRR